MQASAKIELQRANVFQHEEVLQRGRPAVRVQFLANSGIDISFDRSV